MALWRYIAFKWFLRFKIEIIEMIEINIYYINNKNQYLIIFKEKANSMPLVLTEIHE